MVPVTVFTVQKIDVEPDAVFLSGRMYKPAYRASCSFEELIATVDELPPIRIFKRIDGDAFTRPPGWTTFERWRIPGRDVSLITLTARHSCYGSMLWDHSTHLSDIQIQKVRIQ